MASIHRETTTYLLVAYRPTPKVHPRYWRCPDRATFERFVAVEAAHRKSGTPVPDPVGLFGEAPAPPNKKTAKRQAAQRARDEEADRRSKATPVKLPTVAEWLGDPKGDRPGRFFEHANAMSYEQRLAYQRTIDSYGAHIKDTPLDEVTFDDARKVLRLMLVCPACVERARSVGRKDLLAEMDTKLLATEAPWDAIAGSPHPCRDEDGNDAHYTRCQRATISSYLWQFRALWRAAATAGELGHEPAFATLSNRPFEHLKIPTFADRPTNDDFNEAFTHEQLDWLRQAMPDWLAATPWVGAYGMMRRSELLGLERGMITWPSLPEHHGQAIIRVSKVFVLLSSGKGSMRSWGKTPGSTREPIYLARLATAALREHMNKFRSTEVAQLTVELHTCGPRW